MASRVIEVPSFEYGAFYYPQILEALLVRKRIDAPEITDESEFEPYIQILRSFACVGHLNNVLLDMVANESTLATAQLVESVRNMLQLIGYNLASAAPASTELVYQLSRAMSSPIQIVPEGAQAATRAEGTNPVIYFEALAGASVTRTDQFTSVQSSDGGVFTNHTAAANAGTNFTPWPTPATGDALYFGHDSVMWDLLTIDVVTALANIVGVWEYYDGDPLDVQPTAVSNLGGGSLQLDLTSLLGELDRRGASVRITLNATGVSQTVTSTWDGFKNIATIGLLGQTSPSVDVVDYTIGSDWSEIAASEELALSDGTASLTVDGDVRYALPQTEQSNWRKVTVNGVHAYWLRFRVITVSGPTSPTLARCRLDMGKQYTLAAAAQGRSVSDDPLGSSTGAPDQRFETTRDHFIDDSEVFYVDGEEWTKVDNFLGSSAQDKHYMIQLGDNDRATVITGNGLTGRIPPIGQGNISIDYRHNAEANGNVGANTIVVDKTGLTYVNRVFNPRRASGWAEAEGASAESLARAKVAGPATLRIKEVALNGDDAIELAQAFIASDGTSPFGRATYVEESFGPKTIEIVLVGAGGTIPTAEHLAELELYFNGNKYAHPPVRAHYIGNQRVHAVSFDPYYVDLDVFVEAPADEITPEQIVNSLVQVLQPEAMKSDGLTYEWDFGGRVPGSRLAHEVFKIDEKLITDVDIPMYVDAILTSRQLPVARTLNVTILEP